MSNRSVWCDVDKETRKYILKRDKKCIFCDNKKPLTMAHIFISRAKGGKGCKENIVSACTNCHYYLLDNPIGKQNIEKSKQMLEYAKNYLIEKENIKYSDKFIESLKYKKEKTLLTFYPQSYKQKNNVCKNCIHLIKKTKNNSTINTYYFIIKKQIINKNREVCENFKNH